MKLTLSLEKDGSNKSVMLDSDHQKVSTRDEDLLDLLGERVDWNLSTNKEAFRSHLSKLLEENGYSVLG